MNGRLLPRRDFIRLSVMSGLGLTLSPRLLAQDAAEALYDRSVVIDGLGFPGGLDDSEGERLSKPELEDLRSSGLAATHLTIGEVGQMPGLEAFEAAILSADRWDRECERYPQLLTRIRQAEHIFEAHRSGRVGLIYGLQDGVAFADDLDRLPALRRAGVRVIQPTYNRRNLLGDGCMEPSDAGLSRTGVEAVARIQSLGITLDLSHCGRRTAADALQSARAPVSFTHTGCDALIAHPRHRTDAEMRAAADSGGIVGIYVMPYLAGGRQPTAANVIAHVEHAIDIAGEDHVAIGTDGFVSPTEVTEQFRRRFREITQRRKSLGIAAPGETEEGYLFAADLNTPRRLETLTRLLLSRGHSESRVEKLLGANLVRVFRDTWTPAGEPQ